MSGGKISGLIIIDKAEGLSSQAVVSRVKRLLGSDKAGHTGTLDPLATGVLPVLVGRAVKASEFMLTSDKHYLATLLLGVETDTEDITGNVINRCDRIPSESEVRAAVSAFVGKSFQTPPMYSALKVGGKKLYELAREGKTVEREPREIYIESIECKRLTDTEYSLEVKCSKGTYIRTLCADIGRKLGVYGTMKTLRRMSAANFALDESVTLEALMAMSEEERFEKLLPVERIFLPFKEILLDDFFARLAGAGQEIYLKKIKREELAVGQRVRLCDKGGFFAVGEVREFDTGRAIKPVRQFRDLR